jgi:hypothetical protein
VRQLLTETTLLGALEVADFPLPFSLELTLDPSPDGRVFAFTVGISAAAGMLLGLVPAVQSTRPDVVSTLKQETAGGGQPGQLRWRNALIVTHLENEPSKQSSSRSGRSRQPGAGEARSQEDTARA